MVQATVTNHTVPYRAHRQDADVAHAFDDLLRAYSPFGQVRTITAPFRPGVGVGGYSGAADPYSLDYAIARQVELSGFQAGLDRQIYGGGKGLELHDMVVSSAGEAVERMLGSFASLGAISRERGRLASHAELVADGLDCLGPESLQHFAHEDYDRPGFLFTPWKPDTRVLWIPGVDELTGAETWVPAQFVHLFHLMQTGEERIGVSSSGGLATHIDRRRALHHAVLELIERDAINLRWFSRMPPARIVVDRPFEDARIADWLESARRAGLTIEFFYQSVDIDEVAVVTAVAWDEDLEEWSYFAGGGVGLDTEEAIRGALAELIQAERMIRIPALAPSWDLSWGIKHMFGSGADMRPEEFSNFIQVVPYYGHRKNRDKLDWYFRPPGQATVALSSLPSARPDDPCGAVLDVCRAHALQPVVFDFTPAMFSSIALVKVVIPGLVPAFAPGTPLLGHPRYRQMPQRLGLRDDALPPSAFTLDPLPYP